MTEPIREQLQERLTYDEAIGLVQEAIGQWGGPERQHYTAAMNLVCDNILNHQKGLDLWGRPLDAEALLGAMPQAVAEKREGTDKMWWNKKPNGVVTEVKTVTGYNCSIHGQIHESSCPMCDLCKHEKPRTQHCEECAKDTAWWDAPITDDELGSLIKFFSTTCWGCGPGRRAPNPHVYSSGALIVKALKEYASLREAQHGK